MRGGYLDAMRPENGATEIFVFLEDFYNSLCLRKFERKNKFEVTNWQPFHFLCFAVNRYQRHSS